MVLQGSPGPWLAWLGSPRPGLACSDVTDLSEARSLWPGLALPDGAKLSGARIGATGCGRLSDAWVGIAGLIGDQVGVDRCG